MSASLRQIATVDDLYSLDPLARFEALIAGPNFHSYLRNEPIRFDRSHPIYGYSCGVPGCEMHATQAAWWCTKHNTDRLAAARAGVGEAQWLAAAIPITAESTRTSTTVEKPHCRLCPERDVHVGDLCRNHYANLVYARRTRPDLDENAWALEQKAYPGLGPCLVMDCARRAEFSTLLCGAHQGTWIWFRNKTGLDFDSFLRRKRAGVKDAGVLSLESLPPLLAAEIRYALWTHTQSAAPARWHPMWLRRLVKSCGERGVRSLLELNPVDPSWTRQPGAVNRLVREMQKDVQPIHRTRADTRELGYLDTNYWGFRFKHRRSPFNLTAIPQRWLRDLTWDFLASQIEGPNRPRRQGTFEAARRTMVSFGTYLSECDPRRGEDPSALSEATAKDFANDLRGRVANKQPVRGVYRVDGRPSIATATTYPILLNALRKVMRWTLESGVATTVGLPREFIVAIPTGGASNQPNPRPFTDHAIRVVSDPAKIELLNELDQHDTGVADIWTLQFYLGRRIGEVVQLRLDCVGEINGKTWIWVDMTKVGKLDYAVPIPRHIYELVRTRQAKTIASYRFRHGVEPTADQQRMIALFPSRFTNPTFERSLDTSSFSTRFRRWLEMEEVNLPGHKTHQARHSIATRLMANGANMPQVKRFLGHVSERMSESYVLIAGSQIEPFLQELWVTGPGNPKPGKVVMTPTDAERGAAEQLLVDLSAIPTEGGLCTFKPVVGGADCPYGRECHACEHFVLTGADYTYWKRQEERWTTLAEGAPDGQSREYIYAAFEPSSQALAGLEKALLALGLLDEAKSLDVRSPHQDFFDPIWAKGWRANDLVRIGSGEIEDKQSQQLLPFGTDDVSIAS